MTKVIIKIDKNEYDISQLINRLSFTDTFNNGCSKLEFSYSNNDLNITNGCAVCFIFDSEMIFYGYVFKISRDKGENTSCIAYDQLRYCKAKDILTISGDTITTLTNKMCNYFNLKKGEIVDTKYKLSTASKDDNTWLDIIYSAIEETKSNKNKQYILRDEFGSVCLRDTDDMKLDIVLGDNSMCYDFKYSRSIDNEFYNQIKIDLKNNYDGNQFVIKKDEKSISKYGLLQFYDTVYNSNIQKERAKAESLLEQYNKETETLSLNCLGDIRIRAGCSFYGLIGDIDYDKRLIVKSVTHNFIPVHTMEVEAML